MAKQEVLGGNEHVRSEESPDSRDYVAKEVNHRAIFGRRGPSRLPFRVRSPRGKFLRRTEGPVFPSAGSGLPSMPMSIYVQITRAWRAWEEHQADIPANMEKVREQFRRNGFPELPPSVEVLLGDVLATREKIGLETYRLRNVASKLDKNEPLPASHAPPVLAPATGPTAPPSAPPPAPKPDCDPPYVIDAAGHRQYTPECLK